MKFKQGQQVVCTKKDDWHYDDDGQINNYGPTFNEIVTIERYDGTTHLVLLEYNRVTPDRTRDAFNEIHFEPLVEDSVLEKELESIEFINARW